MCCGLFSCYWFFLIRTVKQIPEADFKRFDWMNCKQSVPISHKTKVVLHCSTMDDNVRRKLIASALNSAKGANLCGTEISDLITEYFSEDVNAARSSESETESDSDSDNKSAAEESDRPTSSSCSDDEPLLLVATSTSTSTSASAMEVVESVDAEKQKMTNFKCGCKRGHQDSSCYQQFPAESVESIRMDMAGLSEGKLIYHYID